MSHKRNEEHGKNFNVEKFGKTEIDGDAWLLGDPLKTGNIKGRRKFSHNYTYYKIAERINNRDFKDKVKQYEYIRHAVNFLTSVTHPFLCYCVLVCCVIHSYRILIEHK